MILLVLESMKELRRYALACDKVREEDQISSGLHTHVVCDSGSTRQQLHGLQLFWRTASAGLPGPGVRRIGGPSVFCSSDRSLWHFGMIERRCSYCVEMSAAIVHAAGPLPERGYRTVNNNNKTCGTRETPLNDKRSLKFESSTRGADRRAVVLYI